MDRERAEIFLRVLAEEELRHVTTRPQDSTLPDAEREAVALLRRPVVAAMLPLARSRLWTSPLNQGINGASPARNMMPPSWNV